MSSKSSKALGLAIGAALIGSLSLSQLAAASHAFQVSDLASGYMLATAEGQCGEGECGVATLDTNKDGKVSLAEAEAGGLTKSQFKGLDKNGDGSLDSTELGTMHAARDKGGKDAKAAEGSCGGHKDAEGSCGSMHA